MKRAQRRRDIAEVKSAHHPDAWKLPFAEDELSEHRKLQIELRNVFTSESIEASELYHAGYSFREALYLAIEGGTAPLARWIFDPRARAKLTDRDWKYVAVAIRRLQKPYAAPRGRRRGWSQRPPRIVAAELRVMRRVDQRCTTWRKQNLNRKGQPRKNVDPEALAEIIRQTIKEEGVRALVTPERVYDLRRAGRGKR